MSVNQPNIAERDEEEREDIVIDDIKNIKEQRDSQIADNTRQLNHLAVSARMHEQAKEQVRQGMIERAKEQMRSRILGSKQ